ncbi:MAG: helix-turn-helix domain-containing protein [Candidatus Saccharimonas sp.]
MDFWKVNRLKNGESYTAIAKSLGRSTSTISREVNSFIEEQIQRLPGRKRGKNRQRVNVPAITSLDSRKYRGQVMVSTIRKAKEGVKRRQRLHSKLYSYNAKLAREYAAERYSGVCRASKKLTEPIYARTLAYIKAKLKLRWSPEQISLRIDALLADQTLKDDDGWTGNMGLRPVSHMAIYRCKSGLGSISLVIGYNAASITKQTKVDIVEIENN